MRLALLSVAALLAGCDPIYVVGARQFVPSPTLAPGSQAAAPSDTTPFDVAKIESCVDSVLRTLSEVTQISAFEDPQPWRLRGMSFVIADSGFDDYRARANILIDRWDKRHPYLEIHFVWMGSARTIPMVEQRAMAAVARRIILRLREPCLPARYGDVECIAAGWGGHAACESGP